MSGFSIRSATPAGAPLILALLGELAAYEQQPFALSEAAIVRDMTGDKPVCRCDLGFLDDAPAGIVTWRARFRRSPRPTCTSPSVRAPSSAMTTCIPGMFSWNKRLPVSSVSAV